MTEGVPDLNEKKEDEMKECTYMLKECTCIFLLLVNLEFSFHFLPLEF